MIRTTYAARQIERNMVDVCEITNHPTGPGTLDEITLAVALPVPDVLYYGPCKVEHRGARQANASIYADAEVGDSLLTVKLPAQQRIGVRPGATVEIVASTDPSLVGVQLEVVMVDVETTGLSRRIECRRRVARGTTGGEL